MFSRSAGALGATAAVELLVFALAAGLVDVMLLLLVVVALSAGGSVLLFRQTARIVRSAEGVLSSPPRPSSDPQPATTDAGLHLAGSALLAFPGLVTGLFGALLQLQPVRSAVRPLAEAAVAGPPPAPETASGIDLDRSARRPVVVGVDATERNPAGPSSESTAQPELH